MSTRPASAAVASPSLKPAFWPSAAFGAAGAVYLAAMAPRLLAQAMFGPICSGHAAYAVHCPACYAAAALVGVGLMLSTRVALQARRFRR